MIPRIGSHGVRSWFCSSVHPKNRSIFSTRICLPSPGSAMAATSFFAVSLREALRCHAGCWIGQSFCGTPGFVDVVGGQMLQFREPMSWTACDGKSPCFSSCHKANHDESSMTGLLMLLSIWETNRNQYQLLPETREIIPLHGRVSFLSLQNKAELWVREKPLEAETKQNHA